MEVIQPRAGILVILTRLTINHSCSQSTSSLNIISIILTITQYFAIHHMARHLAMAMIFTSQTILTLTQAAVLLQIVHTNYLLLQTEATQYSIMDQEAFKLLRSKSISCSESKLKHQSLMHSKLNCYKIKLNLYENKE